MTALNLIALFLVLLTVVSFFRHKSIRIVLSVIFSIFFMMQVSSLYLGNSFIDYKYYVHFDFADIKAMAGGFKKEIALLFPVFLLVCCGIFFAGKCLNCLKNKILLTVIRINLLSLAIIGCSDNGIFDKLKEIYELNSVIVEDDSFKKPTQEWGFTQKERIFDALRISENIEIGLANND